MSDDVEKERATLVLVGVDGSPSSLETVGWAADYAAAMGASIELVAAWEWPHSYGWAIPLPEGFDPSADAGRVLAESVADLKKRHPELSVKTTVVEGHAAQVLVEMSRRAGLLAVGSRGHGEFSGMLIGSVSEYCAARAHCPVLIFHRAGKPHD